MKHGRGLGPSVLYGNLWYAVFGSRPMHNKVVQFLVNNKFKNCIECNVWSKIMKLNLL